MTKRDWSKANQHEPDPARVQQVEGFIERDPTVVRVTKVEHTEEYKSDAFWQRTSAQVRELRRLKESAKKAERAAALQKFSKR